MKKNTQIQKIDKTILEIEWISLFAAGFILGGLGGFIMMAFGFNVNVYGQVELTLAYFIGVILLIVAIVLDVFALKELIAESHVRALEVFYGRRRAICTVSTNEQESHNETDKTRIFSWGE